MSLVKTIDPDYSDMNCPNCNGMIDHEIDEYESIPDSRFYPVICPHCKDEFELKIITTYKYKVRKNK